MFTHYRAGRWILIDHGVLGNSIRAGIPALEKQRRRNARACRLAPVQPPAPCRKWPGTGAGGQGSPSSARRRPGVFRTVGRPDHDFRIMERGTFGGVLVPVFEMGQARDSTPPIRRAEEESPGRNTPAD